MGMITIANANALHIPLPDKSVQCIVTSPPYWGLRDYGTAKWEGGNAECDHVSGLSRQDGDRETPGGRGGSFSAPVEQYKLICVKCGARRIDAQIGLESTPAAYVAHIVAVMRECWRAMKDDGVLWLNLGDSYASGEIGRHDSVQGREIDGKRVTSKSESRQQSKLNTGLKPKDLCGIPWRVAFALQGFALISIDEIAALCRAIDARDIPALDYFRAGFRLWEELSGMEWFYNRIDVIWNKPNPMPESVTDRPTKAHEYVFLLTKQARYYYDAEAIKETSSNDSGFAKQRANGFDTWSYGRAAGGTGIDNHNGIGGTFGDGATRNRRSVWAVATQPYSGAHFATFPPALIEPMIMAGTSARGECPHCGKAWVRVVERVESDDPTGYNGSKFTNGKTVATHPNTGNGKRHESSSVGWRQQCACPPHEPIPQTVLDPFAGSGTTGAVSVKHGRKAVLLDLNTKYIDLQFERNSKIQITMQL